MNGLAPHVFAKPYKQVTWHSLPNCSDALIVLQGRVQYGDQIGRTLDFPTINVRLNRHQPCLNGIYGVEVVCETTSLTDKVRQCIILDKTGVAGYSPNSLFGAGHVGTRPAIQARTARMAIRSTFPQCFC